MGVCMCHGGLRSTLQELMSVLSYRMGLGNPSPFRSLHEKCPYGQSHLTSPGFPFPKFYIYTNFSCSLYIVILGLYRVLIRCFYLLFQETVLRMEIKFRCNLRCGWRCLQAKISAIQHKWEEEKSAGTQQTQTISGTKFPSA